MTAHVVPLKHAPKAMRTKMDTMILSVDGVGEWILPPFQRQLRVNEKVRTIAAELARPGGDVLGGVLTIGVVERGPDKGTYLLDGQHRIEAFKISGIKEVMADVRVCIFDDLAEMGEEFVKLNSSIVSMKPDDVLRGLEKSVAALSFLRAQCDFIGYDQIRRQSTSPIVSMSSVLKAWSASSNDTPTVRGSTIQIARETTAENAQLLVIFLRACDAAWGRDPAYWRLWMSLNITLCMWLWRRMVLDRTRSGNQRVSVLTPDQFKKCLMGLSTDTNYIDWLFGRTLTDRDRSPAFSRIRSAFAKRIIADGAGKPTLPAPPWYTTRGNH
jgi:hypothetical protein